MGVQIGTVWGLSLQSCCVQAQLCAGATKGAQSDWDGGREALCGDTLGASAHRHAFQTFQLSLHIDTELRSFCLTTSGLFAFLFFFFHNLLGSLRKDTYIVIIIRE